jgi:hypothetical protein
MEVTRSGKGTDGNWSTVRDTNGERHEPLPGNYLRFSKVQVFAEFKF